MLIVANWKMHGLFEQARDLVEEVAGYISEENLPTRCVICPPATLIHATASWASVEDRLFVGGQDCHFETSGAYTGDVSAQMLKDAGATYAIVGHSERRQYHGESDAIVAKKASAALSAGLTPIICVGETLEQYQRNQTLAVIEAQTIASVPDNHTHHVIIAYEPVWSIGSGKVPGLGEIEIVHSAISAFLLEKKGIAPEQISVLYGGSVKADNAHEIMQIPDVAGLLVGGASLNAEEFCQILAASKGI